MQSITPQEAATLAGVSRGSILKALKEGRIIGYQCHSKQWLVSRKSVVNYKRRRESRA